MTRGIVARRKRHLQVSIPPAQKFELKEALYQIGKVCTDELADIRGRRREEREKVESKYGEQMENARRKMQRDRTATIERFERQFGVDAVKEVLS